jgi:hypothetical protein
MQQPGTRTRGSGLLVAPVARRIPGFAAPGDLLCKRGYLARGPMSVTETHIIRVSLNPKVYRDFEIISTNTLYDLADTIVQYFGLIMRLVSTAC